MTIQESLLVLNAIPGVSGDVLKRLMSSYDVNEILTQKESELLEQGLSQNIVTNIIHFPKDKFLEGEYNYLRKLGAEFITIFDSSYPSLLKQINHAPLVLYVKGNCQLLNSASLALVGCRKASFYGLKIAEEFASYFAQNGLTVVSGLARGIDTQSHRGALKANGSTIAVLGCGLNHIYPKENNSLFHDIGQKGLLVSEFPLNTEPLAYNFPRRNRIISGLSVATVVIEANAKSGALITADYALEQNREVFAVPGNVDSEPSMGTNRLIKDGCKLALSAKEVLEETGIQLKNQLSQELPKDSRVNLSEEEYKIYEFLNSTPTHIDVIFSNHREDIGSLMGQMLNLEIKGVVKQLPGQYYVRI
jgi:DNA processing protein